MKRWARTLSHVLFRVGAALVGVAGTVHGQDAPEDRHVDQVDSLPHVRERLAPQGFRLSPGTPIAPCGARSLALMLGLRGKPVPVDTIRSELRFDERQQTSFAEMAECAQRHGLQAAGFRMDPWDFAELAEAAIVRVRAQDQYHFTVAIARDDGLAALFEPLFFADPIPLSHEEFAEMFTGEVLLIRKAEHGWEDLEALGVSTMATPAVDRDTLPDAVPPAKTRSQVPDRHPKLPRPTLAFQSRSADLGVVRESDQRVELAFPFRNTGDAPLVIRDVRPGCSCTALIPEKRTYDPGEGVELSGTLN